MGLDTVEIILRTEEVFAVDLPDHECGQVRTVGDLYRLVLSKLQLPYVPVKELEGQAQAGYISLNRLSIQYLRIDPWNPADVWVTLQALIQDQLQVDQEEIQEFARFNEDLGCD